MASSTDNHRYGMVILSICLCDSGHIVDTWSRFSGAHVELCAAGPRRCRQSAWVDDLLLESWKKARFSDRCIFFSGPCTTVPSFGCPTEQV